MNEKGYIILYNERGETIEMTKNYQIPPDGFDYIVFREGDYVLAKNGRTGKIEFEGKTRVDDAEVMQSALDDGRVIAFRGTFVVDTPILLKSNIILDGYGALIKLADNANTIIFDMGSTDLYNVTIQGFTFDGNAQNQTDDKIKTDPDTWASECISRLDYALRYNIVVRDCKFTNIKARAVNFDAVYGGRIENCRFYGFLGAAPLRLHAVKSIKVVNNVFQYSDPYVVPDFPYPQAIVVDGKNIEIENNYFALDNAGRTYNERQLRGISVWADIPYHVENIEIKNNYFAGITGEEFGVAVSTTSDAYVRKIKIKDNVFDGLLYGMDNIGQYGEVVGNTFKNIKSRAISFGLYDQYTVCKNNYIHSEARGIHLYNATYITIEQNQFDCGEYAVYEYGDADYNIIEKNAVLGGSGVYVIGSHTYYDEKTYTSLPTDGFAVKNKPILYYDGANYYLAVWDGSTWRKVQLT